MLTRIEKYSLKLEMEVARFLIERCNIFLLGGSITHWFFFVQTPLTSEIVASNKFHSIFPFLFNHFAWLMFVRTYWILLLCLSLSRPFNFYSIIFLLKKIRFFPVYILIKNVCDLPGEAKKEWASKERPKIMWIFPFFFQWPQLMPLISWPINYFFPLIIRSQKKPENNVEKIFFFGKKNKHQQPRRMNEKKRIVCTYF